jgi:phage baseplate assembly protein V
MIDQLHRFGRRLLLMLTRGKITLVDDTQPVQTMQLQLNALELIPDIPRFAEFGFTSNPPLGTQAIVGFKNGDRADGIVIATSNAKYRMTALATGEVAIHDDKGQSVYLSASGITINGGGLPMSISNTPEVTFDTPLLQCTGEILDRCNTNARTMSGMRTVANAHTHDIVNIQTGGSTRTSNTPNQAE